MTGTLFLYKEPEPSDLHSFPTRRSSDLRHLIRSQLVSQLIHVQLVSLDFGPQGVINKIYNLLHHELW